MELSLAGVLGAILGTAVAAVAPPAGATVERGFKARGRCRPRRARCRAGISLRRTGWKADIIVLAGIGYWPA
jgi:hypothetical protein